MKILPCVLALLPCLSPLPWFSDETPAPPKPIYCGPRTFTDFSSGNGTIPSKVNRQIGVTTSRELARFIDTIYSTNLLTEKDFLYVVNVGSFLEMPYQIRVEAIANSLTNKLNTSDHRIILLEARRVANKIQNWSEDLEMLEVEPRKLLEETVRFVWTEEEVWKNATRKEKEEKIWKIVKKDLCK